MRVKAAFTGVAYAPLGNGGQGLEEREDVEGADGWKAMCAAGAANQSQDAGVDPSTVQCSGVHTPPECEQQGDASRVNLTGASLNMTYGVDAESWESEEEKMWLPEYRCE
jgi:hypothetical protein